MTDEENPMVFEFDATFHIEGPSVSVPPGTPITFTA